MSDEQLTSTLDTLDRARLDLAVARRFAGETRKAVAGVRTIELALASLKRRIEAGEDVTAQVRTIAGLVDRLGEQVKR